MNNRAVEGDLSLILSMSKDEQSHRATPGRSWFDMLTMSEWMAVKLR